MDTYLPDSSGINSLAGFSFQIRVFTYYMIMLGENTQIEFETIDDVNIKKIKAEEIDNNDENFICKLKKENTNTAIQVKRTNITESISQKVLLNWILLEVSENNVSKYVLFTDKQYSNDDIIFKKSAAELYQCIEKSDKNNKAIITKVKKKFKTDFAGFEKIYDAIKGKYEFISDNIDEKMDDACCVLFRKSGVNEVVYYNRIKELLQHVTVEVMESVNGKKPFVLKLVVVN